MNFLDELNTITINTEPTEHIEIYAEEIGVHFDPAFGVQHLKTTPAEADIEDLQTSLRSMLSAMKGYKSLARMGYKKINNNWHGVRLLIKAIDIMGDVSDIEELYQNSVDVSAQDVVSQTFPMLQKKIDTLQAVFDKRAEEELPF